jgi:nucleotide-binding universal stress UspA family protein
MKILATVDGSGLSAEILPFVQKLAAESHSSTVLLTVATHAGQGAYKGYLPAVPDSSAGNPTGSAEVLPAREGHAIQTHEQALDSAYDEAFTHLTELCGPLKVAGMDIEPQVVVSEDIVGTILGIARKEGVDLIAMATHGRTGLRAIVQGSVANEVVRSGEFPVILIRPKSA